MPGLFDRLQQEITHQDKVAGLSAVDLLDMEPFARRVIQVLARQGDLDLAALARALTDVGGDDAAPADLQARLDALVDEGYVLRREVEGRSVYHTAFGRRRRQSLPLDIWGMLADRADDEAAGSGEAPARAPDSGAPGQADPPAEGGS